MDELAETDPRAEIERSTLARTISVVPSQVDLPFSIYSTFVIEERYGFNRTTPRTFALDLAKSLLLAVALGTIAAVALGRRLLPRLPVALRTIASCAQR